MAESELLLVEWRIFRRFRRLVGSVSDSSLLEINFLGRFGTLSLVLIISLAESNVKGFFTILSALEDLEPEFFGKVLAESLLSGAGLLTLDEPTSERLDVDTDETFLRFLVFLRVVGPASFSSSSSTSASSSSRRSLDMVFDFLDPRRVIRSRGCSGSSGSVSELPVSTGRGFFLV